MNTLNDYIDDKLSSSPSVTGFELDGFICMSTCFLVQDKLWYSLRDELGDNGIHDSITNVLIDTLENNKIDGTIKNIIRG